MKFGVVAQADSIADAKMATVVRFMWLSSEISRSADAAYAIHRQMGVAVRASWCLTVTAADVCSRPLKGRRTRDGCNCPVPKLDELTQVIGRRRLSDML